MSGKNREKQRVNKEAKRAEQQQHLVADDERKHVSHYKLDWFVPTPIQQEIVESYYYNDLTCVQGSSGTGKSTTVIHVALKELKDRRYRKIVFCKTPAELGDDKIGFLTGNAQEKLMMHFESMRSIFHTFMTKEKLAMAEKSGEIEFTIPNFIAGKTIDDAILIIDEGQLLSPGTVKLILERAGRNTKVFLLGDRSQNYAVRVREDGFTNFVKRITRVDHTGERVCKVGGMGYIEMKSGDNMRSDLSRAIVSLYEDVEFEE
jgi:phosphate starvation-inducible protein PhoH